MTETASGVAGYFVKNSETFKEMLSVFPDADLTNIGKKDE